MKIECELKAKYAFTYLVLDKIKDCDGTPYYDAEMIRISASQKAIAEIVTGIMDQNLKMENDTYVRKIYVFSGEENAKKKMDEINRGHENNRKIKKEVKKNED